MGTTPTVATTESKYFDLRQEMWRTAFTAALPYEAYLEASPDKHVTRWRQAEDRAVLSTEQRNRVGTFVRRMPVLVHSGVWCGDCVRQGPMLAAIAAASDRVELRFAERTDESPLTDELRISGAMRVPVVVFLSEDFFEVGRIGDRMLVTYRRKAKTDLGPACEIGSLPLPAAELEAEIGAWVDHFERVQWLLRLAPQLRERHGD